MADIRYLGSANLTIPAGTGIRLIGEVNLDLEESQVPTYAEADFTFSASLTATPEIAYILTDGQAQGDEYLTSRFAETIEDGTEQGDEVTLGPPVLLFEDGTEQGDESVGFGTDAVTLQDGTAQGDEHTPLPTLTIEDGSEQGDSHALIRWTAIADGTEQGEEVTQTPLFVQTQVDGTAQGDEASLVSPAVQTIQDGSEQGDEVLLVQSATQTIEDRNAQGDEHVLLGVRILLAEDGTTQGDEVTPETTATVRTVLVVDADSGAVSTYQFGVELTGGAVVDNNLLLSSNSGLYALNGEDDDGTAISWVLDTGNSHLGSPYLKRLSYIDVLHRTEGVIDFRLISAPFGEKRSDQYTIPARTRTSYRDGRVKVGRGIKSVYYGLGLTGTGTTEIDAIQVEVELLSRRR
jgi:hypothetical protein